MSPTKAIALGIFLNVITVVAMERVSISGRESCPRSPAKPGFGT